MQPALVGELAYARVRAALTFLAESMARSFRWWIVSGDQPSPDKHGPGQELAGRFVTVRELRQLHYFYAASDALGYDPRMADDPPKTIRQLADEAAANAIDLEQRLARPMGENERPALEEALHVMRGMERWYRSRVGYE